MLYYIILENFGGYISMPITAQCAYDLLWVVDIKHGRIRNSHEENTLDVNMNQYHAYAR